VPQLRGGNRLPHLCGPSAFLPRFYLPLAGRSDHGPGMKPSICKMVLDAKPRLLVVHVDPAVTQALAAEPYFSVLKRLQPRA